MAVNIFDKYGIKEVANVYFEALETDKKAGVYKGDVVLFLDTLKVSTIETSAESVDATGGWGNPRLISWDYGKEINLSITDALISLESLRFMLGGAIKRPKADNKVIVHHTAEVIVDSNKELPQPVDSLTGVKLTPVATTEHPIRLINLTSGVRTQLTSGTWDGNKKIKFKNPAAGVNAETDPVAGDVVRAFWETEIANDSGTETAIEVTISPNTFPGTYKVVGDTFMRSQKTGADEPFQFIIEKAKVASSVTITLEAEGDPSTFEMQLNVLRSGSDEMMKLIRYNISGETSTDTEDDYGSLSAGTNV